MPSSSRFATRPHRSSSNRRDVSATWSKYGANVYSKEVAWTPPLRLCESSTARAKLLAASSSNTRP